MKKILFILLWIVSLVFVSIYTNENPEIVEKAKSYFKKDKQTSLEDVFYHLQEKSDAKYMFLISIKDINAGDELTANYNLYTYPKTGIGLQTF